MILFVRLLHLLVAPILLPIGGELFVRAILQKSKAAEVDAVGDIAEYLHVSEEQAAFRGDTRQFPHYDETPDAELDTPDADGEGLLQRCSVAKSVLEYMIHRRPPPLLGFGILQKAEYARAKGFEKNSLANAR